MNTTWWYLARSSGIVATVLIVAALAWGFLFSARETGKRLKPNWWLDLHNWLGGLALAFTVVHMLTVLFDSDLGIRLVDALVPGTAKHLASAIGWGVVAFWLIAIATITSVRRIKATMKLKVWHAIHLVSIPGAVFAGLHSYWSGTDAHKGLFKLGLAVAAGAAIYPTAIRVLGIVERRTAR
jgi:predicted ferric reductase